ncbi:hypothetical protein JHK82_056817 [Glycine max]|uniref:HMA domain-containing protein n=1 Tax=Glycine max TaxID=3847 RepID=A0A0R0EEE4_SOYBN|nr:hypothetical protein JHK86_056649 [Glycine max]KAG4910805.1 hypothetical protein JHK87_056921 [Glycine soja]KAG4919381.1 hypothetical protein JHK85_057662 [Glycine max]KAG5078122.1 hypothetical protein JHK82_056817 [Glycine max]
MIYMATFTFSSNDEPYYCSRFIIYVSDFLLCSRPYFPSLPFLKFKTVVLKVGMSCEGCVGAVKRVLGKLDGVESYDIDLKEQKVVVKGNVQPDTVLATVSKTGKKTTFWEGEAAASETSTATA